MAKEKFERTKPHVNVGTIGHVDHGKTTLTAAITQRQAAKGLADFTPFDQIDKAPEERERGITIATAHVEYQTERSPLRARRLSGPRGLREEHDHGRGADGRCDPGGIGGGRSDAADPRARAAGRQVNVPHIVVFLNKVDQVDDEELLELVEMEVRELLSNYEFPGDDIPIVKGSALKALEDPGTTSEQVHRRADGGAGRAHSGAGAGAGQAVPDAGGGRVLDHGSRDGGDGPGGAGDRSHGRRGGDRRDPGHAKTTVTGVEMFRKILDEGQAGDNVGCLLRGTGKEEVERGQVLAAPVDHAAHEVQGPGVHPDEGRGRSSHAVLQRLPTAVLLPDDGRDGCGGPSGRDRDGDAGRQRGDEVELITPIAMDKELRFAIREGGRTVGAGVVAEIIE